MHFIEILVWSVLVWSSLWRKGSFTNYVCIKRWVLRYLISQKNIYKAESVNSGGRWSKKEKKTCQRSLWTTLNGGGGPGHTTNKVALLHSVEFCHYIHLVFIHDLMVQNVSFLSEDVFGKYVIWLFHIFFFIYFCAKETNFLVWKESTTQIKFFRTDWI